MSMLGQKTVIVCGTGRTKQSFKDRCNINKIIARHRRSGMIDHVNRQVPFYGDVSSIVDYANAINVVKNANDLFNKMSASVRERFANDPALLIEFLANEKNIPEAVKLGICKPKAEPPKAESGAEGGATGGPAAGGSNPA